MLNLTAVVCSVLFACLLGAQPSPVAEGNAGGAVDLLVFAPHPDDEALGCAGIIRQALAAGKRVKIVIFTHGDGFPDFASALARKKHEKLTAEDFLELARYRQEQSQAALAVLGGKKVDLIFLGYPDSGLDQVYEAKGTVPFQQKFTRKSETYGVAQPDYHSAVHGRPAPYTHAAALADVVELIRTFKPLQLYVTSEGDEHLDHKAAFWFVRDAVNAVGHRGGFFTFAVHAGPEWPWPKGSTPEARFEAHEVNGQQIPLGVPWPPSRRVQLTPEVVQLKLRAIRAHTIPLAEGGQRAFEDLREYFESFVKVEEVFWAVTQSIPEEALKKLRHDLGGSFVIYRDKVQEELTLTNEQKEKLEQRLQEVLPDAMKFFQTIKGLQPEERKKELEAYRPKAQEKLAAVLKETLNEGQRKRLRQLELQREGLRDGKIWKGLQVTNEQRKQFMAMMQQAQKKIQALMEELQKSGELKEIQLKVIKIRDDLEGKLEALLTDSQKKQWKEMLGKPMDMADLFDL